ncbi:MAG: methylated-DNA--[protein]-cysteine S-methyltransferase [Pseudomonadota bacterium]
MTAQPQSVGVESPLGPLRLWAEEGQITGLDWQEGPPLTEGAPQVLHDAADQLSAYFAGTLTAFDLPLKLGPGEFQAIFQNSLLNIPYGETRTYGNLAQDLGVSAQAAGQACGANRIPIFVPCHRVLGASSLGGFSGAGGVETKVELLKLEGAAGLLI